MSTLLGRLGSKLKHPVAKRRQTKTYLKPKNPDLNIATIGIE
jgi:hypothetical protein